MNNFESRGLISINQKAEDNASVWFPLEIGAHDLINSEGFKFEEDAFINNFTKLELELAMLEGEIPQERFSNIMALIGSASAAVSAYSAF